MTSDGGGRTHERSAREYHACFSRNPLDLTHEYAVDILEPVTLVDNDEAPVVLRQLGSVVDDDLVRREDHREVRLLIGPQWVLIVVVDLWPF